MASAMDTDSIVDAGRSECDESVTKGHNEVDLEFPNKYLVSAEDNSTNPLWTSPIRLNIALKNSVFSEALMYKPQINKERRNSTFAFEVRKGIEAVVPYKKSFTLSLKSVSIKSENEGDINDAVIFDNSHDTESYDPNTDIHSHLCEYHNASDDEEFKANDFLKLAEYLHEFADSYCSAGEISLCILWCIEKYVPLLSEVLEFYAALLRLQSWHNGTLNVITQNKDVVAEWQTFLPIYVTQCSSEIIKNDLATFWKGSLSFSVQGKNGPFLYPEVTLKSFGDPINLFHRHGNKEIHDSHFILPVCEVITDVEIGSVPWAFIQKGSLCMLQPSLSLYEENRNNILKIFRTLLCNQDVGTLIRIRHSSLPPNLTGIMDTSTQEWKQTMAEENFHAAPTYNFRGYHQCLILLVLPSCTVEETLYCVALQDCGEDILKIVMQESLQQQKENKIERTKIDNLINGTGEISEIQIAAFSHLILNLPQLLANQMAKTGQNFDNVWDHTKLAMERATCKKIESFLFSHLNLVDLFSCNQKILPEILINKTSWPEYQALEQAEKVNKKYLLRNTSGDLLAGLPPPISSDVIVTIDSAQLLKYFNTNGEAANPISNSPFDKVQSFGKTRKSSYLSYSVDGIKALGWSDSLHLRHHGIYYNANMEQENFEFSCNRWYERHVRSEIISTCTVFQDNNTNLVNNPRKSRSSLKNAPYKNKAVVMKPISKATCESDVTSIRSGSSSFCSKGLRRSPRKMHGVIGDRILRRSPRKRKNDEEDNSMKPSDLLKPEIVAKNRKQGTVKEMQPPKPANLNEVHKQKLRNVIMSSLEIEGINVKDQLFKLCFKKMFVVCKPFALDVIGQGGSTTKNFENIAKSHVKQVVQFEKHKLKCRPR